METHVLRAPKQSGQAIVELALVTPVLLCFVLLALDFGRVFYTSVGLTNAAREGAHIAAVLQLTCDGSSLPAAVRDTVRASQAGLFPTSVPDTTIRCPSTSADRRTVSITNYPFQPITPFVANVFGNGSIIPLSTRATMPVVNP